MTTRAPTPESTQPLQQLQHKRFWPQQLVQLCAKVEASLEALDDVGNVIVTRSANTDGYTWTVTFASCRANETTGADLCNLGDVELLTFAANGSLSGCSSGGPAASSMVVVNGSTGNMIDVSDLSDGPAYMWVDLKYAEYVSSLAQAARFLHSFLRKRCLCTRTRPS